MEKQAAEEKWKDKEKNMCGKIITNFDEKITEVKEGSNKKEDKLYQEINTMRDNLTQKDNTICEDLNSIHTEINIIENGILSIQGKQFRDFCKELLKKETISIEEYEDFEEEYEVYKSLKGNHKGDALHARVVDKFKKQTEK